MTTAFHAKFWAQGLLLARRSGQIGAEAAVALAEKLEAQEQSNTLEQRRNTKRRQLVEAQDDVDRERAELVEGIERQLEMKTACETVFTLRWALAPAARA